MDEEFTFSQSSNTLGYEENEENNTGNPMDDEMFQLLVDELLSQENAYVDDVGVDEIQLEDVYEQHIQEFAEESTKLYRKRVCLYIKYCADETLEKSEVSSVNKYMYYLRDTLDYAGTTIMSMLSMVMSWFMVVHKKRVFHESPTLKKIVNRWKNEDKITKSKVFTKEQMNKYLTDAPDDDFHLVRKIVFIFGVYGLLRRQELTYLEFENVDMTESDAIFTTLRRCKSDNKDSIYAITDEVSIGLVKKYVGLFRNGERNGRFFKKINKKLKPTKQPIGINYIGKIASEIAEFLQLQDPKKYTSHGMRRTGATFLANAGISLPLLKNAGGWKSSTCAEGYIAESTTTKRKIGEMMSVNATSDTTTSSSSTKKVEPAKKLPCYYNITAGDGAVFNFGENITNNRENN